MGYAYDGLVPVALLWKNPGVTKEEFCELLKNSQWTEHDMKEEDPWDLRGTRYNSATQYYTGLHGFASTFGIGPSDFCRDYSNIEIFDEMGFEKRKPCLGIKPRFTEDFEALEPSYQVIRHIKNEFGKEEFGRRYFTRLDLEDGKIISWGHDLGTSKAKIDFRNYECNADDIHVLTHRMDNILEKEHFPDLISLTKSYPQFHPCVEYDFSQEEGSMKPSYWTKHGEVHPFSWKMEDGKYYLNGERMMDQIYGMNGGHYSFQNLVLTGMALERNAGKMISERGLKHTEGFFRDFPGTREEYERALGDNFTFSHAKKEGMRYSEALRFRLEQRIPGKLREELDNIKNR